MRRRCRGFDVLLAGLWIAASILVHAQEGHPLTGTWSGDWGPSATERTHITFVLNWDGENVTGILNPGPDAVPVTSVFVDVTTWTVRIEADLKGGSGADHLTAEGRLADIGSYHRTLSGSWKQGSVTGDFRLTRD